MLIKMLEVIMQNYLHVGKFRFLLQRDSGYSLISKYGGEIEQGGFLHRACAKLNKIKTPSSLAGNEDSAFQQFDYFIPVYHKTKALAFALIGDLKTSPEMIDNDLTFIQTLVNVIVVALEKKKTRVSL